MKWSRHIVGAVPAEQDNPEESVVAMAGPRTPIDSNRLAEMMQQLLKRMERLESQRQDAMQSPQPVPATGKLRTLGAKSQACEGRVSNGNSKAQFKPSVIVVASSPCPTAAYRVQGTVAGAMASFMLDTGAAVTLRREDRWKETKNAEAKLEVWQDPNLVGADRTQIAVLAGETFVQSMVIVKALATECILGMDFLKDNECTINVGEGLLHIASQGISIPLRYLSVSGDEKVGVRLKQTIQVPRISEMEVLRSRQSNWEHMWLLEGVVS